MDTNLLGCFGGREPSLLSEPLSSSCVLDGVGGAFLRCLSWTGQACVDFSGLLFLPVSLLSFS